MRYSIMVQIVSLTTVVLVAAAALFAWLQTRPSPQSPQSYLGSVAERRMPPRKA